MISVNDLNPKKHSLNFDENRLLTRFAGRLSMVEEAFHHDTNRWFSITRGYSTPAEQIEIYRRINEERASKKLPPLKVPMEDAHIKARGADISDYQQIVWHWMLRNLPLLEKQNIYLEQWCNAHVHAQDYPPASGHRIFLP